MSATQITLTRRFATAVLAGCPLLAGCGSGGSGSEPPAPAAPSARPALAAGPATPLVMGGQALVTGARTYLGAVPGTSALIAIVTQGTSARGYLCDGTPAGHASGVRLNLMCRFSNGGN